MSRGAKILPTMSDGGFTAKGFNTYLAATADISSWTQFFHKPYATDWGEARVKAIEHEARYKDE